MSTDLLKVPPTARISDGDPPKRTSAFRFTLRYTFVVVTVVAIWLAIHTSAPFVLRFFFEVALAVTCPALLTAVIVYGRGDVRAFAIGAIFPSAVSLAMCILLAPELFMAWPIVDAGFLPDDGMYTTRGSIAWVPTGIITGCGTLMVRRLLSSNSAE